LNELNDPACSCGALCYGINRTAGVTFVFIQKAPNLTAMDFFAIGTQINQQEVGLDQKLKEEMLLKVEEIFVSSGNASTGALISP
jgi:hypothetical protein